MATLEQQEIAALSQRIFKLEAQIAEVYKHLGMSFDPQPMINDDPEVIDALRSNQVIEAIKLVRQKMGLSLAAATAHVNEMRGRLGI